MKTNNVTRLLQAKNVRFEVFELPEEKLGARETAAILQVPLDMVYKTIVVTREKPGKPILTVIPGSSEVDLKAVAKVISEKKVILPTERIAEEITGLKAGGISPLALISRGFVIILDSTAQHFSEIHISGGQRGLNIRLPVTDLIKITGARIANISTTHHFDPDA